MGKVSLEGKHILFVCHPLMNYYRRIIAELQRRGAIVHYVNLCPPGKLLKMRQLLHGGGKIQYKYWQDAYTILHESYDIVFVINAGAIPLDILERIRKRYDGIPFISYNWDDIGRFGDMLGAFKFFDRVLTYNLLESERYGYVLRPFFFDIEVKNNVKENDLFYIGTYTDERLDFVRKVDNLNDFSALYWLYYNPLLLLKKRVALADCRYVKFRKMPYEKMMGALAKSKACLDFPPIGQTGLTTRCIESLPTKTKLVTNNRNIKRYDFYKPENVFFVDTENPVIDRDWINEPFSEIDDEILRRYTISSFVDDIFDV